MANQLPVMSREVSAELSAQLQDGISSFPRDDINPDWKRLPEWHLLIAKAIWGGLRYNPSALFYNNRVQYRRNLEYALALQPASNYDKFMGITTENKDMPWVQSLDPEIKNYITKRVNILVSKVTSVGYDVEVENINPLAVDAKEDYRARWHFYIDNKAFFDSISVAYGADIQQAVGPAPNGAQPMPELPQTRDEVDMFFDMDYKTLAEIGIELGIEHQMKRCKYDRLRPQMVFNAIVFGVGGLYTGMDENCMPMIEACDPGDLIVPYCPDGDYTKSAYIAQVIWMTVAEFRKSASGFIPDTLIEECITRFSMRPENAVSYTYVYGRENLVRATDVNRIAVLRYNYRSVDTVVAVEKMDEFGNVRLHQKEVDYYSRPKEADRLDKGVLITPDGEARKIHRKQFNTVYEAYWVIGSDAVYRQGPRAVSARRRGALSEDPMGYKIFAPNSRHGLMSPLISQVIPTLNELQQYNMKLRQIVQRAIPKGGFLDLYALRKASLKWNNKELTDQQKIEMFWATGWSLFTSKDRMQPGNNYKPFVEAENGMAKDAMAYMSLIQAKLIELDDIMGLNQVSSASSLSPEMGKGVAEQQVMATDVAIDWLYDFDRNLFEDVAETLGVAHIKSVKYGPRDYYNRIFGSAITSVLYSDIPFDTVDLGIHISVRPTDVDWNQVYGSAEKAYDKGILTYSQILYLREFQSIKQARKYLAYAEKKAIKQQQEQQTALMEQNAKIQQQSVQIKAQGDIAVEKAKTDGNITLEKEKRTTLMLEYSLKTKMLVAVEQAKKGLLPNLASVDAPVVPTVPTPAVETQDDNLLALEEMKAAGVQAEP